MSRFFVAFLTLTALSVPSHAAKIHVHVTAPDDVGKRFAYELREKIASSARHSLAVDEKEAAFKTKLVTLDANKVRSSTIYSVVLNMSQFKDRDGLDFYLDSWVGICGQDVVSSCVTNLISSIDGEIQPIVEYITKEANRVRESR